MRAAAFVVCVRVGSFHHGHHTAVLHGGGHAVKREGELLWMKPLNEVSRRKIAGNRFFVGEGCHLVIGHGGQDIDGAAHTGGLVLFAAG